LHQLHCPNGEFIHIDALYETDIWMWEIKSNRIINKVKERDAKKVSKPEYKLIWVEQHAFNLWIGFAVCLIIVASSTR
jgi:hypothetical protein